MWTFSVTCGGAYVVGEVESCEDGRVYMKLYVTLMRFVMLGGL